MHCEGQKGISNSDCSCGHHPGRAAGHAGCYGMFWPEEERLGVGVWGGHVVLGRLSNSRKEAREPDCMLMGMVEPVLITGWWSERRPEQKDL